MHPTNNTQVKLTHGATVICFSVADEYAASVQSLCDSLEINPSDSVSEIELFALFIEHCGHNAAPDTIRIVYAIFNQQFSADLGRIHIAVQGYGLHDTQARRVLKAYFSVWNYVTTEEDNSSHFNYPECPALFKTPGVSLVAMFGGQLGFGSALGEARTLFDTYGPLLTDFVAKMSAFLSRESCDARIEAMYPDGLNVIDWILHPTSAPDDQYLQTIPVSLPLVGLIQLMQIMVLYKTLGILPGELSKHFKASAGHSQGIAIAAAFAMFTDEPSFYEISQKVLGIQMLTGALPQIAFPLYRVVTDANNRQIDSDNEPRPMLSIQGMLKHALIQLIDQFNSSYMSPMDWVYLAVTNTRTHFIVTGAVGAVSCFVQFIEPCSAKPGTDQSDIPAKQRKPELKLQYLNVTCPYHCDLLKDVAAEIRDYASEKGWVLSTDSLQIEVRASDDGHDIRAEEDLTRYLLQSMCVLPVDWLRAVDGVDTTHIIDFGPGGHAGFGKVAYRNVEGRGISVVCLGALMPHPTQSSLGSTADIFQPEMATVAAVAPNWLADFGPRLVRMAHGGRLHIDTAMHRVYGLPPVMVAGMTPTTVNEDFVATIYNSGYHVELAGGGIHSKDALSKKLHRLASQIRHGQGITLNCIYINQRQWSFQYSSILRMCAEGFPIDGLCIGGGVPSLDNALAIIDSLRSSGFLHISFKPSNAASIFHVVNIARQCPDFPIALQWTGGRAGGHHSLEDFHEPLLQTYAAIRSCKNIVLVVGSGFGDASGSLPYITGDWSVSFGRAPMPVDGILLGSRVMVAKEAGTAHAVKELIVAAPGLDDCNWQDSLVSDAGGVTTVTSEFGEQNHVLVNRASKFVQFIYATILSRPREQRQALLLEHKDDIIHRLNSDYTRPWFGKKEDGTVADLEDMTYFEVVRRLVELMYVAHQSRWIDKSYQVLVLDFIGRTEQRLTTSESIGEYSIMTDLADASPIDYAHHMAAMYPESRVLHIASEDIRYFIGRCKEQGQKPVPFVPAFDADFGTWLQKDTTWQSEDLDAVVDQDAQRVGIQQGVVTVQYSNTVDEPVKDILDGIYHGYIAALLQRCYEGDESSVPVVESIGPNPPAVTMPSIPMAESMSGDSICHIYDLPVDSNMLPDVDTWLRSLAGPCRCWLNSLLTTPFIVQGSKRTQNYIRQIMRPRAGQRVAIFMQKDGDGCKVPDSVEISRHVNGAAFTEVYIKYEPDQEPCGIIVSIHQPAKTGNVTFDLRFEYHPDQHLAPIHQDMDFYAQSEYRLYLETRLKNFTYPDGIQDIITPATIYCKPEPFITSKHVRAFCQNVRNASRYYISEEQQGLGCVPIDYITVLILPRILDVLSSTIFGVGMIYIVHLYNRVTLEDGFEMLAADSLVRSVLNIQEIVNVPAGKQITMVTKHYVGNQYVASLESRFLSREHYADSNSTFKDIRQQRFLVALQTVEDISILESRAWFVYLDDVQVRPSIDSQLEFCLDSLYRYGDDGSYSSISTKGSVKLVMPRGQSVHVANVCFECGNAASDPVIGYLGRHAIDDPHSKALLFEDGGYLIALQAPESQRVVRVPSSNHEYAKLSRDYNPIHTNDYIADMVGLPMPITHGLWTSASTRAIVENLAAADEPARIRMYQTYFVGMVLPGSRLKTELWHVGMINGQMMIKGQTTDVASGSVVLECEARIEQPKTAYVFTGQGSQEVGMGMKLYRESVAARTVWDRAEKHMLAKYGVSLLEIVRNNSKKLTVYFSGRKGEQIRQNYMHLKSFDLTQSKSASILPDLCEEHEQFTFYSSTGLLHSTQFTQVLLFTLAVATIADMKSYGVFQVGATFAGHSLGEYAALVAMCEIFKFEDIIDVVFYRGLVMQSAVKRDKHGRSQYGMVAINPSHVGKWFDEAALTLVVASIVKQQSELLEVVNYNVRGQQYVASGTLVQLAVLRSVLDTIAAQYRPTSSDSDLEAYIEETVKAAISSNIDTVPQRGIASIPLEGIDVPFHSSQLSSGTVSFRRVLTENACISSADYAKLKGRFIPNLTAVPFEVSKEYFELVHRITASDVVDSVLKNWCDDVIQDSSSTEFLRLAKILLVELMAHQISMPVQWINTQDQLFGSIGVCRIIEVGPRPILCGMAAKTLSSGLGISQAKSVSLLHIERDKDTIYYTRRESYEICSALSDTTTESRTNLDNRPRSTEKPTTPQSSAETDTAISNATVAIEAAAAATSAAAAAATSAAAAPASVEAAESELIADVPLAAIDVLRAIVAHKSKRKFQDVLASTSIKSLVAGKSTLQNEIVGDLHKEFGSKVPDKVEELPLHEVAAAIGTLSGDGGGLGKHTQSLLSRLFSNKMPGGLSISSVRNVLQSSYGLGPRRQDALLLVAVTMDPPERLANSQSAMAWLATVAKEYASAAGITYAAAASTASAGGSAGAKGMVISGAALDAIQKKERECAMQQIEVLARYLGLDLRKGSRAADQHKETAAKHQSRLDAIYDELGEDLVDGVQPYFDTRKVRRFDSYWNWIRQDAFEAIQRAIIGKASCNGSGSHKDGTTEFMQRLRNCADLKMVKMLSGIESILEKDISDALQPALQLTRAMRTACTEALDQPQVYIELSAPTRPQTIVSPDGTVKYAEVLREDEGSFADFVAHMQQPCQVKRVTLGGPEDAAAATNIPLINMRKQFTNGVSGDIQQQECDPELSKIYFDSLHAMCTGGISFAGRVALVTGCGKGSIGAEIVRSLLAGGARVIATTSNFNRKTTLYFEELYRACGSRDTELVLVSFNQCSTRDVSRLIDYIYSSPTDSKGLGWDLDFIFPFAAIGDVGSTVSNLGSRSELAQRAMLTNTLRLVGAVKTAKELHTRSAKPAVVVLPLSPNRGVFGGDGLYSECKLGLESAFNRWHSESWGDCLSVIGASIGWTRGTTIMSANNLVAQSIEELGVRTFSAREMAFSIVGLLHPRIRRLAHLSPLLADLCGGLPFLPDIGPLCLRLQEDIIQKSRLFGRLARETALESQALLKGVNHHQQETRALITDILAHNRIRFPKVPSASDLQSLPQLHGMVDLDKVVVITGFGELGPFGSARTRWEIEAHGEFSIEGCIELAWVMGLIKHHDGKLPESDKHYVGWVDAKTGKPVRDIDVKPQYEDHILAHTGIRLIEPELSLGYDPNKKQVLRDIQIEHDMEPFETSEDAASSFKRDNGDKVDVWEIENGGGSWNVRFLKGALIRVPASAAATRLVSAQLPTGWSPALYGIPDDVISQVDPFTQYALVATVEALICSGITDPYELFRYLHVSEIGNSTGSGIGGMKSVQDVFCKRHLDEDLSNDVIQEVFISTVQAWINMLLISASGPVKPVVGACATAAVSIDVAVDTIQAGKARFMIAGGAEDLSEESSTEFSNMGASSNSVEEAARGRAPAEMSRPCTSTRSGFIEGQGASIVTLMSAAAAIEMGAPIYGIVALASTATDKQGSSVPAPGQGILTSAREAKSKHGLTPRILHLAHRREQFARQKAALDEWKSAELKELATQRSGDDSKTLQEFDKQAVEDEYKMQLRGLQDVWGSGFWKRNVSISPLRGSLAVWGLCADDVGMASFHGTSTLANDRNESDVLQSKLDHLGRTPGHVLPVVCQKWLTGHSKGAAAGFMLNGVLQCMQEGLIPGNRNADNISEELRQFDGILYPSKTIQTAGIKAAMLTSFGFGQVGGELLIVHPDYLLAALDASQLEEYACKAARREQKASRYWQDALVGRHSFVQVKNKPPYTEKQEKDVYLNPLARAVYDAKSGEYRFQTK